MQCIVVLLWNWRGEHHRDEYVYPITERPNDMRPATLTSALTLTQHGPSRRPCPLYPPPPQMLLLLLFHKHDYTTAIIDNASFTQTLEYYMPMYS